MFKIDQKVPLPRRKAGRDGSKYPWREMKVGDSFFVQTENAGNLRSLASNTGRKLNAVFTARSVEGGVRVWRVK